MKIGASFYNVLMIVFCSSCYTVVEVTEWQISFVLCRPFCKTRG
jgi:hypothetical protein